MENIIITVPQIPQLTVVPPVAGTKNHSELSCLDFASSGHTGFQKELTAEQLSNIEAVPNKADIAYVDEALANIDLSEYATKDDVDTETTARTAKDTELEGKITVINNQISELTEIAYESTSDVNALAHNTQYRITIPLQSTGDYQLYFVLPIINMPSVFECSAYIAPVPLAPVIFTKDTEVSSADYPISWFGDDCSEAGIFTPQANTHYEISFKRVGTDSDNKPIIIARVGAWQ